MLANINKFHISFLLCFSALLSSCGSGDGSASKDAGNANVTIHELSDPDMLNPTNYQSASAGYMLKCLNQQLLGIDFKTLDLVPWLAESRPVIEPNDEGGLNITYQIRKEATWDNGEPITAKDVEFTLKVIKNPNVDNQRIRPYYDFIGDIIFYEDDPKKFTFICNEVYILAEASSGDFSVLPAHNYDPKGLLSDFTIKQLTENADELENDPKLIEFAEDYNSEKRQREKEFIEGSGPYRLYEWVTGQRVVLERKENWWGDKIAGTNCYFEANAPYLNYQTINDQTTALVALKSGKLDVMRSIKAKDFVDLPNSEKFTRSFNSHTPMQLAYTYLGINTRLPKFEDKRTRQALAHLINVKKQIETILYGLGEQVIGPIHPSKKKAYNSSIVPYEFNPEKAKELLKEVGWEDTDGDGILDLELDGDRVPFNIEFSYNSGNDSRKATALLFQEEARKIGINVEVTTQEWSIYLENTKNHNFEMYYGAWIAAPVPSDPYQIWHTKSYNGGSNYVGFGNAETDALIERIRKELDEDKRAELYREFQVILHEEVPYIFMHTPTERIAIHNRFSNADASVMRPGYWESGFTLGAAQAAK